MVLLDRERFGVDMMVEQMNPDGPNNCLMAAARNCRVQAQHIQARVARHCHMRRIDSAAGQQSSSRAPGCYISRTHS